MTIGRTRRLPYHPLLFPFHGPPMSQQEALQHLPLPELDVINGIMVSPKDTFGVRYAPYSYKQRQERKKERKQRHAQHVTSHPMIRLSTGLKVARS